MVCSRLFLLGALTLVVFAAHASSDDLSTASTISADASQRSAAALSLRFLNRFQRPAIVTDAVYGRDVIDRYMVELDPEQLFFTADDVAHFETNAATLSENVLNTNMAVAEDIANIHTGRVEKRIANVVALLQRGFTFNDHEELQILGSDPQNFSSERELDLRWRAIAKSEWLNLKLAGMSDEAIRATLIARYNDFAARLKAFDSSKALFRFIDVLAKAGKQGSQYYDAAKLWEDGATFSSLGIGVTADADGPIVSAVLPIDGKDDGSIHPGARLLAASVGDAPLTYFDGMDAKHAGEWLSNAQEGQNVSLYVRPAGNLVGTPAHRVDRIFHAGHPSDSASIRLVSVTDGVNSTSVAVVTIPNFYLDFNAKQRGDTNYRSVSRDIAQQISDAQKQGISAIVLDVRNNPGGSSLETIDVASLFIGDRLAARALMNQMADQLNISSGPALWSGPLVVLVNESSSEGAELLAAALQDNGRALIVGEPTYGLGNINSAIDLNRYRPNGSSMGLGVLAMSVGGYFRANGESITGHPVNPDIALPLPQSLFEDARIHVNAWTPVQPIELEPLSDIKALIPALQHLHDARVAQILTWYQGRGPRDIANSELGAYPNGKLSLNLKQRLTEEKSTAKSTNINRCNVSTCFDDSILMHEVAAIAVDASHSWNAMKESGAIARASSLRTQQAQASQASP